MTPKMPASNAIKENDVVLIKRGKFAGTYGCVEELLDNKVLVCVYDAEPGFDEKIYDASSLEVIPPIVLTQDDLRDLAHFEFDIIYRISQRLHARLIADAHYQMTLDDLEIAVQKITDCLEADYFVDIERAWYYPVFEELEDALGIWDYIDGNVDTGEEKTLGIPNATSVFDDARESLCRRFCWSDLDADTPSQVLEAIRAYKRDRDKPLPEREFTQSQKEWFLRVWNNDHVAMAGTPDITAMYVKTVNELAAADVPIGLHEKAYACYGKGNAGFDEDWETSRDCLLKLEEISPSSQYANTLGYIYYYGRCNGGVPEYEKAFYWFSIGAAGGIYESRYKIADMVKDGKGCHKDREIAAHIIWDLYNENLERFCRGWGRTKFADIALRVGGLYRDGVNCRIDACEAYRYFLMAKLAIRMRRQYCDAYGDESVERNIDDAIEKILPETYYMQKKDVVDVDLQDLLRFAIGYGRRVSMDYRMMPAGKGKYRLTFRIHDRPGTKYASKFPVCLPAAHFCGLLEKLVVIAEISEAKGLDGESGTLVFDAIDYNWPRQHAFSMFGETLAQFTGNITVDCGNLAGESRRYVSVSFGDPERCWDYLCDDENVTVGSTVRVPYGDEVREGTVKRVCERFDSEVELPKGAYKRVLELLS